MSILTTFSKIYERVIKNQLLYGMENVFLPNISAYRKSYNSQHVLIRLIEEWREYLDKDFVVGAVMTDLSKALDCIPHDLLIAKLEAYSLGEKTLSYIFSYLRNRNQCVRINDKKRDFQKIISGVPRDSITGPILFHFSINDLFFLVSSASMHMIHDNSLSSANTVTELKNTLQSESEVIVNWLKNNKMLAHSEKFHAIILDKQKHDYSNETIKFDNNTVETVSSVRFLGIQLGDKLNFSLHVSNICKSAANQSSALIRLKNFLCFEGKIVLINSYFMSNFNYCPLVWTFSKATSLKKIENLQKIALRFLYNNYQLPYEELLNKANSSTMNVKRLRFLCVEINNLSPSSMKHIFELRETNRNVHEKYRLNLYIPNYNQVTFGKKSLRIFGPKI